MIIVLLNIFDIKRLGGVLNLSRIYIMLLVVKMAYCDQVLVLGVG